MTRRELVKAIAQAILWIPFYPFYRLWLLPKSLQFDRLEAAAWRDRSRRNDFDVDGITGAHCFTRDTFTIASGMETITFYELHFATETLVVEAFDHTLASKLAARDIPVGETHLGDDAGLAWLAWLTIAAALALVVVLARLAC